MRKTSTTGTAALLAAIALPVFIGVLYRMVRSIHRWEARRQAAVSRGSGEGG